MTSATRMPAKSRGFTLVEILIVVVILGVLAAIVVPQFANASESAQTSGLKSSLKVIRSQLEFYHAQHKSTYPTLAQLGAAWNVLTNMTDADGNVGNVAGVHIYGPYIKQMPMNYFENSRTISDTPAAGVGWVYDEATGRVYAVMSSAKAAELELDTVNTISAY